MSPGAPTRVYLESQEALADAVISPDGRYAAFTSTATGGSEIYVRPFPFAGAGGQWKISSKGGLSARWSGDGRTIFYQGADLETIHAVPVNSGPPFTVGSSEVVASIPRLGEAWDVDRRSGRMVLSQVIASDSTRIIVVMNWLDEFRRTPMGTR